MRRAKRPASDEIVITLRVAAGLQAGRLRAWAAAARRRLPAQPGRLSIVMVSPVTSRRLNRQYRAKDLPTNVLSFLWPATTGLGDEREWGELFLCPIVIRREAPTFGRTYAEHTRRLIEHGLIHLLGHDHQSPADQRRWRRIEQRLP